MIHGAERRGRSMIHGAERRGRLMIHGAERRGRLMIHGAGGGKPRRSLGCDRPLRGASPFGAGKPPLNGTSYLDARCTDQ